MSAAHATDHLVEKAWVISANGMDWFGRLLLGTIDDGYVMDKSVFGGEIVCENHEFTDHLVGWRLLIDVFDGDLVVAHADFHLRSVQRNGTVFFAILLEFSRDDIQFAQCV